MSTPDILHGNKATEVQSNEEDTDKSNSKSSCPNSQLLPSKLKKLSFGGNSRANGQSSATSSLVREPSTENQEPISIEARYLTQVSSNMEQETNRHTNETQFLQKNVSKNKPKKCPKWFYFYLGSILLVIKTFISFQLVTRLDVNENTTSASQINELKFSPPVMSTHLTTILKVSTKTNTISPQQKNNKPKEINTQSTKKHKEKPIDKPKTSIHPKTAISETEETLKNLECMRQDVHKTKDWLTQLFAKQEGLSPKDFSDQTTHELSGSFIGTTPSETLTIKQTQLNETPTPTPTPTPTKIALEKLPKLKQKLRAYQDSIDKLREQIEQEPAPTKKLNLNLPSLELETAFIQGVKKLAEPKPPTITPMISTLASSDIPKLRNKLGQQSNNPLKDESKPKKDRVNHNRKHQEKLTQALSQAKANTEKELHRLQKALGTVSATKNYVLKLQIQILKERTIPNLKVQLRQQLSEIAKWSPQTVPHDQNPRNNPRGSRSLN